MPLCGSSSCSCAISARTNGGLEVSGSGTGGSPWSIAINPLLGTYTPTLTGMAIGTGGSAANTASYTYVGDDAAGMLSINGKIIFGSSGATLPGATSAIDLPSGFQFPADLDNVYPISSDVLLEDAGTQYYHGVLRVGSSTRMSVFVDNASGTYVVGSSLLAASVPFAWTAGDAIRWKLHQRVIRV